MTARLIRRRVVKISAVALFAVATIAGGVVWWFYGPGLSEETSYRLAVDLARRQGFDLAQFNEPVRDPTPSRLYTYSWTLKDGQGEPLTIVVDSQFVEVIVTQFPMRIKTP